MNFSEHAKQTLTIEAEAIMALVSRIDQEFDKSCEMIRQATGRVVVIGMGKSGHVGHKIAATMASTGTPAFFVHPAEASHGDLGMIIHGDVVLAISNSGETEEVISLLPVIKRLEIPLISMTGNENSTLAKQADAHLSIMVEKEACPLNLAPTASTTVTLALGDALAVALLAANDFKPEDFARSHPGGKLGKKLLTFVGDIMRTEALPINYEDDNLLTAVVSVSEGGVGLVVIVDESNLVQGVFTDGDLRRLFDTSKEKCLDLSKLRIGDYMQSSPTRVLKSALAAEALKLIEDKKISALPVVDKKGCLVGVMNMHDLLLSGIV